MIEWMKREFFHVFPVFVFFLIAFTVINIVERSIFAKAGMAPITFLHIFVAAGLIAKILLVIDHSKIIRLFEKKPLIYTCLWKTAVYWAITGIIRIGVRLAPFIAKGQSIEFDWNNFAWQMDWQFFWAVQIVYLMLFFLFVTGRELTQVIGVEKMRKLFFGF